MSEEINEGCGMISFSRFNGTIRLFGSPFEHDEHGIEIRITGARQYRSYHRNKYTQDRERQITRIWMSANQFSEAITNMNKGDGVPCTVKSVGKEAMPEPPLHQESQKFAVDSLRIFNNSLAAIEASLKIIEESRTMSKKEKELLTAEIKKTLRSLKDSFPFLAESFTEFMNDSINAAKAEISAYCQQLELDRGRHLLAESQLNLENNKLSLYQAVHEIDIDGIEDEENDISHQVRSLWQEWLINGNIETLSNKAREIYRMANLVPDIKKELAGELIAHAAHFFSEANKFQISEWLAVWQGLWGGEIDFNREIIDFKQRPDYI